MMCVLSLCALLLPEIYHELEPAGTVLAYDEAGAEAGRSTNGSQGVSP